MKTLISVSLLQQEDTDELNRLKDIFKDYGCTGAVTHETSGSNTLVTAEYTYDGDTRNNVKFGFTLSFAATGWNASANKFKIYGSDGSTETDLWSNGQATTISAVPFLIIDTYKIAGGGFVTRVNKGTSNTSLQATVAHLAIFLNGNKVNYMYTPTSAVAAYVTKFNLDDGEGHILVDNLIATADDPYHLIMGKIALNDGTMLNNNNIWGTIYAPAKANTIGMYSFEKNNDTYLGAIFKATTTAGNWANRIIFKLANA